MRDRGFLPGPSRVKGRPSIEKRLRAVQLAVQRFGVHRATSPDDQRWAGQVFDAITLALARWPERSTTMIADQVGCSQRYVSTIASQVRSSSNLPASTPVALPARVIGKDGSHA